MQSLRDNPDVIRQDTREVLRQGSTQPSEEVHEIRNADEARRDLYRIMAVLRYPASQAEEALDELFRMRRSPVPDIRDQTYRLMGELSRDSSVAPDIREAVRLELEATQGARERAESILTQLRAEASDRADRSAARNISFVDRNLDRFPVAQMLKTSKAALDGVSDADLRTAILVMKQMGASGELQATLQTALDSRAEGRLDVWEEILGT
jgi:hypothetical protein